jgi:hypothetical protein
MLVGMILQTLILFVILFRTKWEKEVTPIKNDVHTTWVTPINSYVIMPFCILNYGVMQAMLAEERVRACGGNVELPPADHPRDEMKH